MWRHTLKESEKVCKTFDKKGFLINNLVVPVPFQQKQNHFNKKNLWNKRNKQSNVGGCSDWNQSFFEILSYKTNPHTMITPECRQRWPPGAHFAIKLIPLSEGNNRVYRDDDAAQFTEPGRVVCFRLLRISLPRCRRNAHIRANNCFLLSNNRHTWTKWNYFTTDLNKSFRKLMETS